MTPVLACVHASCAPRRRLHETFLKSTITLFLQNHAKSGHMPKVSYSSRPLPGYPGNLVPCSLLSGWSPSWESSSGKGTAGSIRKLAFLFNLATETTTQSGHISNRNVFVWLFSVPNSERNIRLPGLSFRRPGGLYKWVGAPHESWTRP